MTKFMKIFENKKSKSMNFFHKKQNNVNGKM